MTLTRNGFLKALGCGLLAAQAPRGWAAAEKAVERSGASKLRIKDVEIYAFDIPLKEPFRVSLGVITAANDVLVRVITDAGLIGLGEASPFAPITGDSQATDLMMARDIREMLRGKNPLAVDAALVEIGHIVHSHPSIVAAFDMALMDIVGKAAGLPLFRLLGGDKAVIESDVTVGMDSPEKMAGSAAGYVAKGYRNIKLKVGLDPDLDAARVRAVREAIGKEVHLKIDANQGWSVPQAVLALRMMDGLDVEFVEQPVVAWDYAGMKAVRSASPIPVCADESLFSPQDALKLVRAEAADYFNIKLMKAGGMTNAVRIAHIADAANLQCMVGCMMETRLGLTAGAHVVASQRNIVYADLDAHTIHTADPVIGGMAVDAAGKVTLPEGPGLGADIDPAFLKTLKRV